MAADPYAALRRQIDKLVASTGGPGRQSPPGPGGTIPRGMIGVTIRDDSPESRAGLDRIFDALGATMDDLPAVLAEALPEIRAAHARVFDTEGAAGRGKWASLAPATLADRARLGFGPGPIQRRTGALRAHVLGAPATISRTGSGAELRIRPDDNVGGVPKYRALALGTSTIPSRPMVALGPTATPRVTSAIQRALRRHALANGLR